MFQMLLDNWPATFEKVGLLTPPQQSLMDKQDAESDTINATPVKAKRQPTPTPEKAPPKKLAKRAAPDSKPQPRKRQKKEETPSGDDDDTELSEPSPSESV